MNTKFHILIAPLLALAGLLAWAPSAPAQTVVEIGRLAGPAALPMRKQMRTFRDMRFRDLMPQRFDFSCGSAALGTLLHYGYGIDTNEAKLITVTVEPMEGASTTVTDRMARLVILQAVLANTQ